ncbi:hypothetical protein ACFPM0_28155 [Pseudonocardia sulfidoxydans]
MAVDADVDRAWLRSRRRRARGRAPPAGVARNPSGHDRRPTVG